jgi:alpha-L-rhamnosidase
VTSTGYYHVDARILSRAAAILGRADDARKYADLAAKIREAFQRRFWNAETGLVASGSQTALGCALYQGFVDPEKRPAVIEKLVAAVEGRGGHLDFGILGSKYVLSALTEGGRADVAYRIASQKTHPSWGHWIEQGATTLWESWGGSDSRNHIMFGDICAWFYKALAGIQADPEVPGFQRVWIRPEAVGDLTFARAAYSSIRGTIRSDWRKEGGTFRLEVEIPANVTALVFVPAAEGEKVLEGGKPAEEAEGVKPLRRETGRAVFEVGSGRFVFTANAR